MDQDALVFFGSYDHTLDDKGRLTMPSKYRPYLEKGVYVTRGFEKCLFVFTEDRFKEFMGTIEERSDFDPNVRKMSRYLYAQTFDVKLDRQGRVLVPAVLREYAELDSEVHIVGTRRRIELWNPKEWEKTMAEVTPNVGALAEKIARL